MKFTKLTILLLALCPLAVNAQKIKYKDLFLTLNSGNYEEGDSLLRIFLSDPKNSTHANANYQMGALVEQRFYKMDILSDTSLINATADSAVSYFKTAIQLIDEKEIKKNDDLYQSFYRRDLRTGEFGITLSDVHLDIEKKIQNIEARQKSLAEFRLTLVRIQGRNKLSATLYQQFVDRTADYKGLLFSLSDDDVAMLDRMVDNAKGIYSMASDIKKMAKELGSDYYQNFQDFVFIAKYGEDGLKQEEMFDGKLELWDYETWATATKSDYYAVKQYLINLDKAEGAIAQAQGQVEAGASDEPIVLEQLKADKEKYDQDGPALAMLGLRLGKLNIAKATNETINPALADSTNVYAQFSAAMSVAQALDEMRTDFETVSSPPHVSVAKQRYSAILDKHYGGSAGYDSYLAEMGAWISENEQRYGQRSASLAEREQMAISGADSVPLFVPSIEQQKRYVTLHVTGEATKTAYGIDSKTNEGYVVWSGPQRDITAKKAFKTGGGAVAELQHGSLPTPTLGFYTFSPSATSNNLSIVRTGDEPGALKWANLITAPNAPVSFRYDATLDQLTVFYFPEDQLPGEGVTAYVVIDRNGNVR